MSSKNVEIQRSQVDELFKSLRDGDELEETDPRMFIFFSSPSISFSNFFLLGTLCLFIFFAAPEVGTQLYPHQKKALTFLLEREHEQTLSDGTFSSLWQERKNPLTGQPSWYHIVTQRETFDEPKESKGCILADDVRAMYFIIPKV